MATKVAVWGTFDGVHEGHREFLRQARALGDELYVFVLADASVVQNKGRPPVHGVAERVSAVKAQDSVAGVRVVTHEDSLQHVLDLMPDIFAFGHDQQSPWEEKLREYLAAHNCRTSYVRLGVYNKGRHGSDLGRSL